MSKVKPLTPGKSTSQRFMVTVPRIFGTWMKQAASGGHCLTKAWDRKGSYAKGARNANRG